MQVRPWTGGRDGAGTVAIGRHLGTVDAEANQRPVPLAPSPGRPQLGEVRPVGQPPPASARCRRRPDAARFPPRPVDGPWVDAERLLGPGDGVEDAHERSGTGQRHEQRCSVSPVSQQDSPAGWSGRWSPRAAVTGLDLDPVAVYAKVARPRAPWIRTRGSRSSGGTQAQGAGHLRPSPSDADDRGVVAVDLVRPVQIGLHRGDVLGGAAPARPAPSTTAWANGLVTTPSTTGRPPRLRRPAHAERLQ